jgi:hypothetical protein
MRTRRKELDVDFIGGQEPLTTTEEKALSDFFKKKKELKRQKTVRFKRSTQKETSKV